MNLPYAKILGYSVAVVCVAFAVLIFTGVVLENIPSLYRNLFGVVVILYGLYRAALSQLRRGNE